MLIPLEPIYRPAPQLDVYKRQGLYCITNFVWTISLYLSNATGYVVQEAYKLDFINDMADSIGKSIQTLAGVTQNLSLIHI